MNLNKTPLLTAQEIQRRVGELAQAIDADYADRIGGDSLRLIVVLKGGMVFAADLIRCLATPVTIDFVRARSYEGVQSTGTVELSYLLDQPLAGAHVLLVEDVLDTGRTTAAILERLEADGPASLAVCVLLDKPARRKLDVAAGYVGFTIDDHFVVGYGLDVQEHARQLPGIHVVKPD